ncbi:MAG: protein disulfide oxidoreductase [Candidatus Thiodiazotropha sp.]
MTQSNVKPNSGKRKRLLRWFAEGLVLLLVLYLLHLWQTRNAIEGTAPALDGQLLDGRAFSLQSRSQGPLLVYFWASWCPVCGLTSGHIDSLAEKQNVLTIAMQSGAPSEISTYLSDKALNFPVMADPNGEIARRWGVRGVPTLYILDRQNRIRFVTVGYTSSVGLALRMWLAES